MRPLTFIAAAVLLAGCAVTFPVATIPTGLAPVPATTVAAWAASTVPKKWIKLQFSWRSRQGDEIHHGGGSAYINPPDSVYVITSATMMGRVGEGAVVGDSTLWAEPKEMIQNLAPSYELLWGLVGIARPPKAGWSTESHQDPKTNTIFVRYSRGADTVTYVRIYGSHPRLETTVVDGGKLLGQVTTQFDPLRRPVASRLVTSQSSVYPLLDISYDSIPKKNADRTGHVECALARAHSYCCSPAAASAFTAEDCRARSRLWPWQTSSTTAPIR